MEKFIKFSEKKIVTKYVTEEETLIETWEPHPSENDPRKEFIIHDNLTYYLNNKKTKQNK